MQVFPLSLYEGKLFLLIMIRVSVVMFMLPFFSARVIPVLVKIGLALAVSISLFSVVDIQVASFPDTVWGMVRFVITELIIGMVLGLLIQLFFEAVRIMGQLVGFQTGFAITNILDPQSGMQVSIFSNMAYLMAVVIFLILNGHHVLLSAMKESFEILIPGSLYLRKELLQGILQISGDMFVIAIKIGAPAIAALLFTKVAFGLITKLMPQMNIMIVAFPAQIVIGLVFFGISLQVLARAIEQYLDGLNPLLINAMNWLRV